MDAHTKPRIDVFLSYAARDKLEAERLWSDLGNALEASGKFTWKPWAFGEDLLAGVDFHEEIMNALTRAEMGVFAVSSAFLASPYIRDHELPPFLAPATGKRIVPVQLKPVPRAADLRGLEARQIFGFHDPYSRHRAKYEREVWAIRLADEMDSVAVKYGLGR